MLNKRLELLGDYAFAKLNTLLEPVSPRANLPPVVMSVGDPQHQPPGFVQDIINRHAGSWNSYPPVNGTPEFRAACAGWLNRRYRLPRGMIDADRQIAPCAGTREGLFLAALLAVTPAAAGEAAPLALMPNPFYQAYYGAAVMAGASPAYLPATRETGFLPDLGAIPADTLARTRLMYLCTPGNPQGACADVAYLRDAITLARKHDFLLVVDECYAEIYTAGAPTGALEAAAQLGGSLDNLLAMHSLSKRSSAAGLRSGFSVGAPETIAKLARLRSYSCAATPLPALEAATALWNDDDHVGPNRALYRQKFALAEKMLGGKHGYYTPAGGFFLWLDVGDGEAATRRLWADAAVKVLPGAYITRPDSAGHNAGLPYIRVALVHDLETTEAALQRVAHVL